MPIYEFYCGRCHRIYSFLSRGVDTTKSPDCPKCGEKGLARRASSFAVPRRRGEPDQPAAAEAEAEAGMPDMDEGRLMRALEQLGPEAESLDENDPRQAASLMRRLFGATGMPVNPGMEEALRRMEAGEDPEKVEAELGDALDQDPFAAPGAAEPGAPKPGLASLRRRVLPPSVDTTLYEL